MAHPLKKELAKERFISSGLMEKAKRMSSKPNYFSAVFGGFSAVPVLKINTLNRSNQVEYHLNGGKLHFNSNYMIHPQTVTTSVAHKTSFSAEIDQKVRFMIYCKM